MTQAVQPMWFTGQHAVNTPYGVILPPGGRVAAYVRSGGVQEYDSREIQQNLCTTIGAALTRVRANLGDTIVCLPGHSESSASTSVFSGIKAGTRIVGIGDGGYQPTLRLTGTTAKIAVAVANVSIENMFLNFEGANGVAKCLEVTGADFTLRNNRVQVASATDLHCLIAVELGTGAHRARVLGNKVYGIVGEPITDAIHVAGAITDFEVTDNVIQCASVTGAAASLIRVSGIALRGRIGRNILFNTVAASDNCIVLAAVASQGIIHDNYITVLTNDIPTTSGNGISIGATSTWGFFGNRVTTNVSVSGELAPVVDA